MKLLSAMMILALSSLALAQQDQKLPNGKWAYYGQEFYTTLASGKKFEKDFFKLNQTVAHYKFFFVTNEHTYNIMQQRYQTSIPDVEVILLK